MRPKQIGPYEIQSEIGGNERGQVFEAFDPNSNRTVALKMLRSQSLFTLTGERKFMSQLTELQALKHPHLLPIIDFGDEDNRPFIVMPLMSGNLTERIEAGPLPILETLDWFRGLADALDFAADRGFTHLDLKPNNILFDLHGNPFISDLGIVQVIDSLSAAKTPDVNPHYVSPEQVRRRPLTGLSQEYSLAALLFHALTGQVLFQGATDLVASFKHTSERPRDIRMLRPELNKAFSRVMTKALSKDPEDRYPSARAFIQELVRAHGGDLRPEEVFEQKPRSSVRTPQPLPPPPEETPVQPMAQPVRPRLLISVIAAVVVCLCGVINFLLAAPDLP